MTCHRLKSKYRPAPWWHRAWCQECRMARGVDSLLAFGVGRMQNETLAPDKIRQAQAALDLDMTAIGRSARRVSLRGAQKRWRRRAAKWAVAGTAFGLYWHHINVLPAFSAPTVNISPNGYPILREATTQIVGLDTKTNLIQTRRATQYTALIGEEKAYTDAQRSRLLTLNAPALSLLREGLRLPYHETYVRSINTLFPHYAGYRELARLLAMQAKQDLKHGDAEGAAGNCLDALELGIKIPNGSPLIADLVGVACEAIGRRPLWDAAPKLNAQQALAATQRLQTMALQRVPFADVMQEEQWNGLQFLHDTLRNPGWRFEFGKSFQNGSAEDADWFAQTARGVAAGLYLMRFSDTHIWTNYKNYSDAAIVRAHLPYQAARRLPDPPEPDDPLTQLLFPIFAQAGFKDVQNQAQDALLTVTLALRAYQAEHGGQNPGTLDALVPRYLHSIPADPFVRTERLHYRRKPAGDYVLYSVGPDGKDDGGTPIDNWRRTHFINGALRSSPVSEGIAQDSNNRYYTLFESTGDMVAGITDLPNPQALPALPR